MFNNHSRPVPPLASEFQGFSVSLRTPTILIKAAIGRWLRYETAPALKGDEPGGLLLPSPPGKINDEVQR